MVLFWGSLDRERVEIRVCGRRVSNDFRSRLLNQEVTEFDHGCTVLSPGHSYLCVKVEEERQALGVHSSAKISMQLQ